MFVISLLSGGAASAAYASDNDDFYNDDSVQLVCTIFRYASNYDFIEDGCNDIHRVRDAEGASAVSYGVLLLHMIST